MKIDKNNPKQQTTFAVKVTVPYADTCVIDWLNAQANKSQSIRALIRNEIKRRGYLDVTCEPVEQSAQRGRPPKQPDVVKSVSVDNDRDVRHDEESVIQQPKDGPDISTVIPSEDINTDVADTVASMFD